MSEYRIEQSRLKQAYAIYDRLLNEARAELEKALKRWEKLQDDLVTVKMMEFAASCDDSVLLPEEKLLLDEMNQKLRTAQDTIDFWKRRIYRLEQYEGSIGSFSARLETDMEMHRLRLNLSRLVL